MFDFTEIFISKCWPRFPKSCIRELILRYLTIFLYRSDQLEGMHSVLKIVSSAHIIKEINKVAKLKSFKI